MRITCPTCETSYNLAADAVGPAGRKVRCTRCGMVWMAHADAPPPEEATAEAEWAAVEETAASDDSGPPANEEPSDDDWRAALSEPDEVEAAEPAPEEGDDAPQPDGDDTADGIEVDAAETAVDESDAGETPAQPPPGPLPPATIDAEPAGFSSRRRTARPQRQKAKPAGPRIGTRIASAVVVVVAAVSVIGLLAGSLFARDAVVRRVPDLASLYAMVGLDVNLRGLVFNDFRSHRELDGATPVLVVEGSIENVSDMTRPVPRLRFGLRSTTGREVYAWTMDPATPALDPGRSATFKSRLPTPPEAAADVLVRFTDRKGP